MMLDVAARTMRCDKCVEKRNEVVLELERRSLLEKRMAMEKVKFNAQQESLLEFPFSVCLDDFEDARELSVKVRYYRLFSIGCMECDSLPHRRWGARAGVMSVSRPTKKRMGWSATGLTRKLLAEKRRIWFAESMTRVQETVEVLIRCGAKVVPESSG